MEKENTAKSGAGMEGKMKDCCGDKGFTPEMMAMIRGEKSVEESAASAQERINAVLARVYAP